MKNRTYVMLILLQLAVGLLGLWWSYEREPANMPRVWGHVAAALLTVFFAAWAAKIHFKTTKLARNWDDRREYRLLDLKETVEEGDEFFAGRVWVKAQQVGCAVSQIHVGRYRRKRKHL